MFFTNQPDHYVGVEGTSPGHTLVFTGLNLPEFRQRGGEGDPAPAMEGISKQHPAVMALYQSIMALRFQSPWIGERTGGTCEALRYLSLHYSCCFIPRDEEAASV